MDYPGGSTIITQVLESWESFPAAENGRWPQKDSAYYFWLCDGKRGHKPRNQWFLEAGKGKEVDSSPEYQEGTQFLVLAQ